MVRDQIKFTARTAHLIKKSDRSHPLCQNKGKYKSWWNQSLHTLLTKNLFKMTLVVIMIVIKGSSKMISPQLSSLATPH